MSSRLIFRGLYAIIHGVYTILEWICYLLMGLNDSFVDFCHEFGCTHRTNYLKREIERRNKVPEHLTVLLGNEQPSYKDLANIIVWCMVNHIIFVSFYHPKGVICKHKLENALNGKLQCNDHVVWHDSPSVTYRNGFIGNKIHVKILTQADGKASLVNLIKSLSENREKINDFSVQSIDVSLHKYYEFPDPELGLYCGKHLQFFAYPPWQMRLTEFLSIKSHHNLSYRRFLEQLYNFSKSEQRKGK